MLRRHTDIDNFHSSLVPFTRGDGSKGYLLTSGQPLRADVWPPITEDRGTSDCAQEGGTFRVSAPARVPRHRPLFKTAAKMRADGWEPANWSETLAILAASAAILVTGFGLWAYFTWGGK